MVDRQIRARGISNADILAAMLCVPRHLFVDPMDRSNAYQDRPLPIGHGQTISQPYIVAAMCEALNLTPETRVLDVGTGSGYAAAVLSELSNHVTSLERIPELAELAKDNLARSGYDAVDVVCEDGSLGYSPNAPYGAIVVAAGAPSIPEQLQDQLDIGGRLVIPIGPSQDRQSLIRVTRVAEDEYETENLGDVRFVPLLGEDGWTLPFWQR